MAAQNGIPWWYFHGHGGPHDGRRIESGRSRRHGQRRLIRAAHDRLRRLLLDGDRRGPGVIRHVEGTRFSIGEPDRRSPLGAGFSEAMVAGGLKCPVEAELREDVWIKLMGNAAFNPLSVLTRATHGARSAARRTTREIVASDDGGEPRRSPTPRRPPADSIERRSRGAEKVGDHKTSMLQDLEAGKSLELAPITGAVIELADLTGIEAPALRAIDAAS